MVPDDTDLISGARGKPRRWRRLWDNVTIEPVVGCYMTAFTLITLTVQNLNLQKACKVNLKIADDVCDALLAKTKGSAHAGDEALVQELVTGMMLWQTCIQNVVPCVLMLLVGSWSDRTRRRVPCMLLPLYGELVRNAGQLVCVYFFDQLPMQVAGLAETIPLALTGGQTLMTMTTYSYVGDITSAEQRTTRIGGINAVMAISMALGTSLSGIVYNSLGFYGAYGIASLLLVIGLLYGSLCVEDVFPITKVEENKSYKTIISEFFDFKSINRSLFTAFKDRPNNKRLIVLLIILMAGSGTNAGVQTISYLYTRLQFNWNEVIYSVFATYEIIVNIIGLLFAAFVLSKKLHFSDEIIGVLSTISRSLSALYMAIAYNESLFFFGPLVNILITAEMMSIKSLMTKLVASTELSQTAAVFSIAEIIVTLVFGLLYNIVYEATLNTFPGAFYLIGFVFNAPSIFLFLWMYMEKNKKRQEYLNVKRPVSQSTDEDHTTYGAIEK